MSDQDKPVKKMKATLPQALPPVQEAVSIGGLEWEQLTVWKEGGLITYEESRAEVPGGWIYKFHNKITYRANNQVLESYVFVPDTGEEMSVVQRHLKDGA